MIVDSITASTLGKSVMAVMESRFTASLLMFALWITALMSGSVLVILLGLVVYLRPLLYVALLSREDMAPKSANAGFRHRQTLGQKAAAAS
jgi:hypothetical protein